MHRLLVALALLSAPLAGCVGQEGPAPQPAGLTNETSTTNNSTMDVEQLAVSDTNRSTFDQVLCENPNATVPLQRGCMRRLSTLETGPANEVMVRMDPSDPDNLIAASKDYRAGVPDCAVVSYYRTEDGGDTWEDGYPRGDPAPGPGGTEERCESDPVIAFDGRGNALLETLDVSTGLFTYRSTDEGETWNEVAMAFEGNNDKNWMATDYRTGRVYSITRSTCDGGQAVTYTDDAGDSWQGPFCFQGMDFAQIAVGPEGTVYAVGRQGPGVAAPGSEGAIMFAKSEDGRNWTEPKAIAQAPAIQALPGLGGHAYRTPALPDVAVSLGTGALYAVWHAGGPGGQDQDVFFTASFDGGETFTDPVEVNDGDGPAGTADQFIPAVAASPAGDAHVIFFDSRNDPTGEGQALDVYYAHNPDPANESFEPNLRLTPVSFQPYTSRHQSQPFFIGDYIGLAASNAKAFAVYPTTHMGRSEIQASIVGG